MKCENCNKKIIKGKEKYAKAKLLCGTCWRREINRRKCRDIKKGWLDFINGD